MKKSNLRSFIMLTLSVALMLCVLTGCTPSREYEKADTLTISLDLETVTNFAGATDFSRLDAFYDNFQKGNNDAIIMHYASKVEGRTVFLEIILECTESSRKITVISDSRKDKFLLKDEHVVTTVEYNDMSVGLVSGVRMYKLIKADGSEYILAKRVLYS